MHDLTKLGLVELIEFRSREPRLVGCTSESCKVRPFGIDKAPRRLAIGTHIRGWPRLSQSPHLFLHKAPGSDESWVVNSPSLREFLMDPLGKLVVSLIDRFV